MTAPADWLTGPRPPLPFRERTPLYDQAKTAAAQLLRDLGERERTAVLYRVEELTAVLDSWPVVSGVLPAELVEQAVKPRRWSRKWWRENWTAARIAGAGASVLVFAAIGAGWFR